MHSEAETKTEMTLPPTTSVDALPVFKKEEIARHDSIESGVWVVYKDGVYDLSEFVAGHPGGEIILLAAGS